MPSVGVSLSHADARASPAIGGAVWLVAAGPGLTAVVALLLAVLFSALAAILTLEVLPPRVKRFFSLLAVVVGVVLGVVALPNILDKTVSDATPTQSTTPQPPSKPERLATCRKAHAVSTSQPTGEGKHASCVWPPPAGAGDDGYCEITVKFYDTGRGLADDQALVWTFDSKAAYVAVEWWVAAQGNDARVEEKQYRSGQIVDFDGQPTSLPVELRQLEQNREVNTLTAIPGHLYPRTATCT